MKRLREILEDIPANAMGTSSSTPGTGAIDTFDPILGSDKDKRKKRIKDMWRRMLGGKE